MGKTTNPFLLAVAIGLAACGARTSSLGDGAAAVAGAGGSSGGGATPQGGNGGQTIPDSGAFVPSNAKSCMQPDGGSLLCNGESCCTSIVVPGGTFLQARSEVVGAGDYFDFTNSMPGAGGSSASGATWAADELPEFPSTVSRFALDKYQVTVGRFRKFTSAYVDNAVSAPAAGAGANPAIPGSGWQTAWNANLPATQAAFNVSLELQLWAYNVNENWPMNGVTWYEAFAFCVWDGGRLTTESEWEYAAAGGAENRLFPWGSALPDCTLVRLIKCGPRDYHGVGSFPAADGLWGHAELASVADEWVFDWYGSYPYAGTTDAGGRERVQRGGCADYPVLMRTARRLHSPPDFRSDAAVRCARTVQN